MIQTINRAQRRAAIKAKRHTPQRIVISDIGLRLLKNARPFEPGQMAAEHIITTECLARLRDGSGTEEDFDRVLMLVNVGLIRAESIDESLVKTMKAGQAAMERMKDRYQRGLRFGFDAQGLTDTMAAMEDYQVIMDASSPLQMIAAIKDAYSRITNGQVLRGWNK